MRRARHRVAGAVTIGAALTVTAAGAAPAFAYTLNLSGPASAVAGQPLVIQASGNDPTDAGALYLEVDEISASVATTCPGDYLAGSQLATSTGGALVAFDDRESLDGSGNFSIPVGFTPSAAGGEIMCGYTDDGATDTLATATLSLTVAAPGGSPAPAPARPANTAKPRVSRSGRTLTCSTGTWSGSPSAYRYTWLVSGHAKHGAATRRLAIARSLRGRKVQCRVTAVNAAGASRPATSAAFRVK